MASSQASFAQGRSKSVGFDHSVLVCSLRFLFFKRGGLTRFIPDGVVLKSFVPSRLDALKLAFKDGYVAIFQMMVSDGEESLLGQLVPMLSSKLKFVFRLRSAPLSSDSM